MCVHSPLLGKTYPGCFCVYCGARLAELQVEEGQLALAQQEGSGRRYVAALHKEKQRVVEGVSLESGRGRLRFRGDAAELEVSATALLSAFQAPEEVLRVG